MKRPGGFDSGADQEADPESTGAPKRQGRVQRPAPAPEAPPHTTEPEQPVDAAQEDERPPAPARRGVLDRLSQSRGSAGARGSENVPADGHTTQAQSPDLLPRAAASPGPVSTQDDLAETQELAAAGRGGMLRLQREAREVDPVRAAQKRLRAAERQNKRRLKRETRRFTASSRRRRRHTLIVLGTVAGLVLFVLVGTLTPVMAVREVRVEGATSVNAEEIEKALAEFSGVPLALVDENDVLRSLEAFPLIQRLAVERVPPSTLVVRIQERIPVIALEAGDSVKLYDAAGVLVGDVAERPEGVPLGGEGMRTTSSKGFLAASQVVRDMPGSLRAQLVSVSATSGQDVTFTLANGVEVFWGNPEETKRKSLVLETMLASLEGREVSHIDVSSTESPIFK